MTMIHPYLTDGTQSGQSIWEIATTVLGESEATHPVGTRGVLPDGRVYYYARNTAAAAIVAGKLLTAELQTAQFTELAVVSAVVGSTTITPTLGSTAVTLNEYAEGYAVVIDAAGEGIAYKILSHPAASGTAACVLTLHDPLQVAITNGASTVQVLKNPWADVVISPAGKAHIPAGVSNVAVPAGNAVPQYFWCQTWGPCPAWQDEIVAIGSAITSGTTIGQVETWNAAPELTLGWNFWTSADTEYAPVFLRIAP